MKKLFLALPILLAGCQSERVAFQFQPGPVAVGVARPAGPVGPAPVVPAASEAQRPAPEEVRVAGKRRGSPVPRRWAGSRPAAMPTALAEVPGRAAVVPGRPGFGSLLARRPATTGPARTTENGLGRVALFFIAVFLGVLVGLGALVSLIPGVSLLGGIGLAAAGLLVLFLLYSLLSGGRKKK